MCVIEGHPGAFEEMSRAPGRRQKRARTLGRAAGGGGQGGPGSQHPREGPCVPEPPQRSSVLWVFTAQGGRRWILVQVCRQQSPPARKTSSQEIRSCRTLAKTSAQTSFRLPFYMARLGYRDCVRAAAGEHGWMEPLTLALIPGRSRSCPETKAGGSPLPPELRCGPK